MGEELERKRAQQFKMLGDRALARLARPGLWSSRPDVPATDCVFNASGVGGVNVDDPLTLEAVGGKIRAVSGNREVGTMDDVPTIYTAIVERGGVVSATVRECSVFDGFTARIREEMAE